MGSIYISGPQPSAETRLRTINAMIAYIEAKMETLTQEIDHATQKRGTISG